MYSETMQVALDEFIHVGGGLTLIIAAVSILTGFMREYLPQEKLQKALGKQGKWGILLGAASRHANPFLQCCCGSCQYEHGYDGSFARYSFKLFDFSPTM